MQKLPISICILSWKSHRNLINSLRSYHENGLLDIVQDTTILFQEVNNKDKQIAEKYGVKYIGLNENIGIGKGMTKLAENAAFETILFLEHDWELIEDKNTTLLRLTSGFDLLNNGFDIARYRSRKNPGYPLLSIVHKGHELEYYDDWHQCTSPHLLESIHWLDPAKEFSDKIQKQGEYFITTARWANWTNNPFLIRRDFLLNTIRPFTGDAVALEKNIAPWWVKQNFKIAQGEGLFKHNDLIKYPPKGLLRKIWGNLKFKLNRI